jgi:hypothetical protein
MLKELFLLPSLKRLRWQARFLRFGFFIDGVDGDCSNN